MTLSILLSLLLAAASSPESRIDLVTHNQVQVEAAPARVWLFILDPNSWKAGSKLRHVAGPPH